MIGATPSQEIAGLIKALLTNGGPFIRRTIKALFPWELEGLGGGDPYM